jgi:hypothetical protein
MQTKPRVEEPVKERVDLLLWTDFFESDFIVQ